MESSIANQKARRALGIRHRCESLQINKAKDSEGTDAKIIAEAIPDNTSRQLQTALNVSKAQ
eukprot:scaffold290614_cov19-Prasinocladus_malaysianus.AAC.1